MANEVVTKTAVTQNDFETFKKELKLDIKTILSENLEKLDNKIDRRLSNIKYWGIGGATAFCIVFTWLFDYKFDYTNEKNQARFERIESSIFIPAYGIKKIENQTASANQDGQSSNMPNLKKKPKTQKVKK